MSFRSPRVIAAGAIAIAAPLLLLVANSDWFFTREGYLDPWNYVGLFKQYLDPDYLPEDYKLARLPWILAGFLVHSALPAIPAAYVLHAFFLCASSLALFVGLVASLRRIGLAALLATLYGFYPMGHGSGGWDYHSTAGCAFYLWTFALLALPSTIAGRWPMLVCSGVMAALAVHTNIMFVNFLPALAFVYLSALAIRMGRWPPLATLMVRAGWVALGAVVATVALSLINWNVGRNFVFFAPLLNTVARYLGDAFYQPAGWIWTAKYLALPAAVAVAGIVFLVARRRGTNETEGRLADAFVLQFLAMSLLWIGWQIAGKVALEYDYFVFVLIPSCFIALAGILSRRWCDWCERHWVAMLLVAALLLCVALVMGPLPGELAAVAFIAQVSFVVSAALFFAGFAFVLWRPGVTSVAILLVTCAFGNRLVAGSMDYVWSDPCKVQVPVYGAIVETSSWLMTDLDPLYSRVRIWFDEEEVVEPLAGCPVRLGFMATSAMTMASMGYVARVFPMGNVDALPDEALVRLASPDRMLVIISNQSAALEAWRLRLEGLGLVHEEIGQRRVEVMQSGFTMHVWNVRRRSP